jgi:transposase
MTHILGIDRSQLMLLLDLKSAGFARVTSKATGRPGYAPGDLLKLYIYSYFNRVRSSRRLEAECHRNIEVIWLLRTLKPDSRQSPISAATIVARSGGVSGSS